MRSPSVFRASCPVAGMSSPESGSTSTSHVPEDDISTMIVGVGSVVSPMTLRS